MKLLRLTLDNFKGTKHFSLDLPEGCSAAVYGENGTGKTTLADAWCWLLFGVDSKGQSDSKNGGFQVSTKGTSGLDYSVSAVIEVDGRTHTLRRVYREEFSRKNGESEKGQAKNHTDYYLDDTPLKTKKQYDAFIDTLFPSREIGRALTIPSYFPRELEPGSRRELLLKLFSPEITEDSVMDRHPELARLRTYKGYKTVEQYRDWAKAQRTAVNKELDSIPGRIDEANLAKREEVPTPEDDAVFQRLQAEKAKLAMKISAIRSGSAQMDAIRRKSETEALLSERRATYMGKFLHANDALNADAQALRKEISDKERAVFLLKRKKEERILFMEGIRKEIDHLGEEWQEWQGKRFDESSTVCPTCGQPLPPEQIQEAREKFNLTRSETIRQIEEQGTQLRERLKRDSAAVKEEQKTITAAEQELAELQEKLDKLAATIVTPPPFEETEDFRKLTKEIEGLRQEEAILKVSAEKQIAPLLEKEETIQQRLDELARKRLNVEMNRQQEQRIRDLLAKQKELNLQLTTLDDGLTLADQFIRLRAMDLEEDINSHFEVVRWKLFDIQVNGGVKTCCEATADNDNGVYVEYSSNLNDGRRIQAGVDIANAVAKATGITAPIWIDGAGELTRELHTDLQCIRLYASEADKQLRVEV
nr:MAG TPA: chromosome partition protein [Caudoviricetes sp.]